MAYQHTAQASKGNAFCWQSWEPQIDWKPTAGQVSAIKCSQHVDAQRAAGIEPLFIPGMGSAAKHDPTKAARFAIDQARKRGRHAA